MFPEADPGKFIGPLITVTEPIHRYDQLLVALSVFLLISVVFGAALFWIVRTILLKHLVDLDKKLDHILSILIFGNKKDRDK